MDTHDDTIKFGAMGHVADIRDGLCGDDGRISGLCRFDVYLGQKMLDFVRRRVVGKQNNKMNPRYG